LETASVHEWHEGNNNADHNGRHERRKAAVGSGRSRRLGSAATPLGCFVKGKPNTSLLFRFSPRLCVSVVESGLIGQVDPDFLEHLRYEDLPEAEALGKLSQPEDQSVNLGNSGT
jgi:hypothetical protein